MDGGTDGLVYYRKLCQLCKDYPSLIVVECGYNQAEEIVKFANTVGFSCVDIQQDYQQLNRVVSLKNQWD